MKHVYSEVETPALEWFRPHDLDLRPRSLYDNQTPTHRPQQLGLSPINKSNLHSIGPPPGPPHSFPSCHILSNIFLSQPILSCPVGTACPGPKPMMSALIENLFHVQRSNRSKDSFRIDAAVLIFKNLTELGRLCPSGHGSLLILSIGIRVFLAIRGNLGEIDIFTVGVLR